MGMIPLLPPLLLRCPPSLQVSVKQTFQVKEKLRSLLYTYNCPVTASTLGRQCQTPQDCDSILSLSEQYLIWLMTKP